MRIRFLPAPDGDVIARESQSGEPEGEFFIRGDGTVSYRSIGEDRIVPANRDAPQLKASVASYNRYLARVAKLKLSDDWSPQAREFRRELEALGVDLTPDSGFWGYIVEQAEDGLL